ncbi:hypothetical protein T484DRAFT_1957733 [Baffinella frigidus]|nr:hypothetical protein T484DRAFT_1957733 [Cryptophyta sp. CCMP2293]
MPRNPRNPRNPRKARKAREGRRSALASEDGLAEEDLVADLVQRDVRRERAPDFADFEPLQLSAERAVHPLHSVEPPFLIDGNDIGIKVKARTPLRGLAGVVLDRSLPHLADVHPVGRVLVRHAVLPGHSHPHHFRLPLLLLLLLLHFHNPDVVPCVVGQHLEPHRAVCPLLCILLPVLILPHLIAALFPAPRLLERVIHLHPPRCPPSVGLCHSIYGGGLVLVSTCLRRGGSRRRLNRSCGRRTNSIILVLGIV